MAFNALSFFNAPSAPQAGGGAWSPSSSTVQGNTWGAPAAPKPRSAPAAPTMTGVNTTQQLLQSILGRYGAPSAPQPTAPKTTNPTFVNPTASRFGQPSYSPDINSALSKLNLNDPSIQAAIGDSSYYLAQIQGGLGAPGDAGSRSAVALAGLPDYIRSEVTNAANAKKTAAMTDYYSKHPELAESAGLIGGSRADLYKTMANAYVPGASPEQNQALAKKAVENQKLAGILGVDPSEVEGLLGSLAKQRFDLSSVKSADQLKATPAFKFAAQNVGASPVTDAQKIAYLKSRGVNADAGSLKNYYFGKPGEVDWSKYG